MTSSTEESRAASSSPCGTSNGTRASARVFLARTIRCATVGSGTRKARAISPVVRPPSSRRVSAARASVDSSGWQATNTSRSRSSPMPSSSATSAPTSGVVSGSSRPTSASLRRYVSSRRIRSIARRLAVVISHAPGFCGTPSAGHCSSAATRASCASSSAVPRSRTSLVSPATSRGASIRQTVSIARWVSVGTGPVYTHRAIGCNYADR